MQTSPVPWIQALRHSHDALRATVEPLEAAALDRRSYASEWSIAQVLSHLGSQAEIFGLFLVAGASGADPPGQETFAPIWAAWNAKAPQSQASDALEADRSVTEQFESLGEQQRERLRLRAFGMDVDAAALARMRLGEHAIHSWDIAVALDPVATVVPDAVSLLVDTMGQLAARASKPGGLQRRLQVATTSPERHFVLDIGDTVTLGPATSDGGRPDLVLPAEALIRLVYGRLDPAYTPPIESSGVDIDELRRVFPGF